MEQRDTYENVLWALETINSEPAFKKYWDKHFPQNTITEVWDAHKSNLLSKELQKEVFNVCPLCYSINNVVFLHGEEKGNHDFIGDELDFQQVVELFDMTEEMKTGNSYTFYTSSVSWFKKASPKQCFKVKDFLFNLYK